MPVNLNYWAPLGSASPQSCRDLSGFYCPGRFFDEVNEEPGSLPIKFETGQTLNLETATTTKLVTEQRTNSELRIGSELTSIDAAALRERLAAIFEVSVDRVQLKLASGSVIASFSISHPSNDPDAIVRMAQRFTARNRSTMAMLLGVPLEAPMATPWVANATRNVTVAINATKGLQSCPQGHCRLVEARMSTIQLCILPTCPLSQSTLARLCAQGAPLAPLCHASAVPTTLRGAHFWPPTASSALPTRTLRVAALCTFQTASAMKATFASRT